MQASSFSSSIAKLSKAIAASALAFGLGQACFASDGVDIRFDNPCRAGQACEWEAVEIELPQGASVSPDFAASKGVNDCLVHTHCNAQNKITTVRSRVYVKKADRTSLQAGRMTRVVTTESSTQVKRTEQVVSLPVAGAALDINRYDELRFGWFHPNGAPVRADHKFRTGDIVNLYFLNNRAGHLYVVGVDSAGMQTTLYPLPGSSSENPLISANLRVLVDVQFVGRTGVERAYAIFSPEPIPNTSNLVTQIHRRFEASPVNQMRLQAGTFSKEGQVSGQGLLISQNMQPISKGLMALSSSVQTSSAVPTLETGAVVTIDPIVTLGFPYSVMALDLIHVSP